MNPPSHKVSRYNIRLDLVRFKWQHSKKFSGNQGKHQNFDPSILPYKFGLIFMGMKQKKNFFFRKKKNQNGQLKKSSFFKIANSQNFFHENVSNMARIVLIS